MEKIIINPPDRGWDDRGIKSVLGYHRELFYGGRYLKVKYRQIDLENTVVNDWGEAEGSVRYLEDIEMPMDFDWGQYDKDNTGIRVEDVGEGKVYFSVAILKDLNRSIQEGDKFYFRNNWWVIYGPTASELYENTEFYFFIEADAKVMQLDVVTGADDTNIDGDRYPAPPDWLERQNLNVVYDSERYE